MKAMRYIVVIAALLTAVLSAAAYDLGTSRPAKPEAQVTPPPPDPALLRQGGDTILDAVPIDIEWWSEISGTTAGYTNDYDEICPYSGSTAPDVVYTFTPAASISITVDLYGSSYDTKVYIYDQNLMLVACNDDFYSDWTSRIEHVEVVAGVTYYLIIDGYGGDYGVYIGYIERFLCCLVVCPDGAELENEPEIVDGYVDAWNGGCYSPEFGYPFQPITQSEFCGKTGYYLGASGESSRDTDWFHIILPAGGVLAITGYAEDPIYMFELGRQDCGSVAVIQNVAVWPDEATMTITGPSGSLVWFWVGPQQFWQGDTYEFDYLLSLNLEPVAVENHSWSSVKALFE